MPNFLGEIRYYKEKTNIAKLSMSTDAEFPLVIATAHSFFKAITIIV